MTIEQGIIFAQSIPNAYVLYLFIGAYNKARNLRRMRKAAEAKAQKEEEEKERKFAEHVKRSNRIHDLKQAPKKGKAKRAHHEEEQTPVRSTSITI